MKLSCIPICLFDHLVNTRRLTLRDWVRMAVELGLDGIEMYKPYLECHDEATMQRASELIHEHGLAVSMFTSYGELAQPEPSKRAEQIASIRADIDAAVIFRTSIVRMTAGSWHDGITHDENLKFVAMCLKESLDYAEGRGVSIALEDHPEIGVAIADFMRILELVDDERLKVNLDTSNPMVAGDDPVELTERVKSRVVHVHVSDRADDLSHQVIGEGVVDFPAIFRILKSVGYDGWLSLEAGGAKGVAGIQKAIAYVRNTWASA